MAGGSVKAAELLVRCLENEGVRRVFGIPGEETVDLNEALEGSDLVEFIPTRHEQGAAFMADAHGRLTGRAGVCLATLGPGATNLATGVADAYLDRAPLVALTGQARLAEMHKESHQYVDIVRLLAPVTKWNARVHDGQIIPEAVRKAFATAEREKPGATHLELPEDVMQAPVAGRPLERRPEPRSVPLDEELERASELLGAANSPVVLAGNGVVRRRASEALRRFCEHTGIGAITTFMGKGSVEHGGGSSLFTAGLSSREYLSGLLGKVDLVICVGYDLIEWSPEAWNPNGDRKIICIDSVPAEVDQNYLPDVQLIGELSETLTLLRERVGTRPTRTVAPEYEQLLHRALEVHAGDTELPLKPQTVLLALRDAMDPEDLLISDVGAHKLWISRFWPAFQPNTVLISNGAASMGFALPAGVGAALTTAGERRVVTVSGDGGFLMNIQELETARRLKVRLTNIVWSDGAYGVIELHQQGRFGRAAGTRFGNPDFAALAESFGVRGFTVTPARGLRETLADALAWEGTSVVEIPIDARENAKLGADLHELAT